MELHRRVEQISALVAELRQAAGDGPKTRELIDSIFRSVHSFKAAAAAEGRNHASSLAHSFENLLHDLRTGKTKLDDDVLRVFEDTTAALLSESDALAVTRLTAVPGDASSPEQLPAEFSDLKDEERHRLSEAIREGANAYVMEATFDSTDFDQRFRQLNAALAKVGEVISTEAKMEGDFADRIGFRILYAAQSEKIRVQPFLEQAVLAGKSLAAKLAKEINFVIKGDELLLDRSLRDALADALLHLVRNAVDHGIESSGKITLELITNDYATRVLVSDNGRGIDPANLQYLFQPGFSTATEVSEISGRGVGLNAAKTAIKAAGGDINVISRLGKFTSFVIRLPNPS